MASFDPEKITFFAKTDARGQAIPFGIKAKDRQRHMYVVGKTGMGKSTLLENMAAQDIASGEGMAFIDPHGSAAETLLEYVPEHRVKDVIYFAPFDLNHPISFNVMEDVGPDKRHLVVSGLMSTFKKIWVDAWSARMEYILTNALLVLIEYPDTTLLSVNRLFVDKEYRKKVVEYCKDPAVKAFWAEEFASYTDRFAAEALPAIQNKIGQFTGNPLIRNIIGQPHSSFDIRQIMDEKKILIMNLSKGLIGETNANLLGSMLTTRIYLAAMSRADLSVDVMRTMPNFYFYVDEFQSFANATFANILSEARKYHLNLIIAHQYIEQMEEEVRNAVFGNVGTTIAFRVGPFDAEVLETVFSPRFLATDLVNLGFAQIYLTLMIDGIGSQPFSAQTLPPVTRPHVSCKQMVISSSRALYASEREKVEEIVMALHATTPKPERPAPVGNGRRDSTPQNGAYTSVRNNTTPRPSPAVPLPSPRNSDTRSVTPPRRDEGRREESPVRPGVPAEELKPHTTVASSVELEKRLSTSVPTIVSTVLETADTPRPPAQAKSQGQSGQSIEELRAVLARLAKQSEAEKEPTSTRVATVGTISAARGASSNFHKPENVKSVPRNKSTPPKEVSSDSTPKNEVRTITAPPPEKTSPRSLKDALRDVLQQTSAGQTPPVPAVAPLSPRPAPPPPYVPTNAEQVRRDEVQAMADEAETIMQALEASTISPKVLKQILRGGNDRSPFM